MPREILKAEYKKFTVSRSPDDQTPSLGVYKLINYLARGGRPPLIYVQGWFSPKPWCKLFIKCMSQVMEVPFTICYLILVSLVSF